MQTHDLTFNLNKYISND